jgi:hypothetical protein
MSLFTSSAPAARSSVAYFLAIILLLGGLLSLYPDALFDASLSSSSSSKHIAQDDSEFSWDMVYTFYAYSRV